MVLKDWKDRSTLAPMSSSFLLRERRFWPLFWTQFAVAFNDNVFRNGIILLVTYRGLGLFGLPPEQVVALATGIILLPYFLFSAPAGQLADKLPKSQMIRRVKFAEIFVMLIGAAGFYLQSVPLLIVTLFAMGFQSAMFAPAKYSIIPQLVGEDELIEGNAWVELGTYVSVLIGTLVGGLLIAGDLGGGPGVVGVAVVAFAIFGWIISLYIPDVPAVHPELAFSPRLVRPALEIIAISRRDPVLWNSILGISWFWAFGTIFLALFPTYAAQVLYGDELVATFLTALFSFGVGGGALLCSRLSRGRVELGLVPLGSIGLTLFSLDVFLVGQPWSAPANGELLTVAEILVRPVTWRILIDLTLLSFSGGLFAVPLYALLQQQARPEERSRVIAGNNMVNSALMVGGSVSLMILYAVGVDARQVFVILALVNLAVAVYIYRLIPEFFLRFVAWVLSNLIYRLEIVGEENFPSEGPAVLVCNHVTYVDWLIVGGAIPRPARFIMDAHFMKIPVANRLMRQARIVPIAPARRDPEVLQKAMQTISEELAAGHLVCIFPEGRLTPNGEMLDFKPGVERILAKDPVPVVPMALNGLWGSSFSKKDGRIKLFRRFWSRIRLTIDPAIPPEGVTAEGLRARVMEIWGRLPDAP
ncbi:MAG: MFS transporter [Myxococcota bacterium]